jgi:hypothetical protein
MITIVVRVQHFMVAILKYRVDNRTGILLLLSPTPTKVTVSVFNIEKVPL